MRSSKANSGDGAFVVLDANDVPQRYPRAIGRQPLTTVNQVREEMARVYKATASGKITTRQGAQMVHMLQVIGKTIEVEKIEPLLEEIRRWQERNRIPGG